MRKLATRSVPLNMKVGGRRKDTRNKNLISEEEAYGIHDVARSILHLYPKDVFVYISIGSSPSIITRYMKVCDPAIEVIDFPFSSAEIQAFSKCNMEKIFAYYENTVDRNLPPGKKLLLIDICEQGRALAAMKYLIQQYESARSRPVRREVVMLALNNTLPEAVAKARHAVNPEVEEALVSEIQIIDTKYSEYMAEVQDDILGKVYKQNLELVLFGRHEIADISSGALTAPMPSHAMVQRLLIVLARIRDFNRDLNRGEVSQPWEYDEGDRFYF